MLEDVAPLSPGFCQTRTDLTCLCWDFVVGGWVGDLIGHAAAVDRSKGGKGGFTQIHVIFYTHARIVRTWRAESRPAQVGYHCSLALANR